MLLLLLLAYGLWLVYVQWTAAQAQKMALAMAVQEQQARNSLWEAEIDRLHAALKADPCLAQQLLQQSPALPGVPRVSGNRGQGPAGEGLGEGQGQPLTLPPRAPADTKDALPPPAQRKELPAPANLADFMEQGTVLILAETPRGLSMGTGFFIAPGIVLTNEHVTSAHPAQVWIINKATGLLPATLQASSSARGQDFAVLQVPGAPAVQALSFAPDVRRTDKVSAWGFPNAITADDPKFQALLQGKSEASPEVVYTDGVVSVILDRKPPLIVHTATVSQGNSGGPLINAQGQVVGINTYIRLDEESYRQSSLAIMGAEVMAFLKSHGIPHTLAPVPPAAPAVPAVPVAPAPAANAAPAASAAPAAAAAAAPNAATVPNAAAPHTATAPAASDAPKAAAAPAAPAAPAPSVAPVAPAKSPVAPAPSPTAPKGKD